MTTVLALTFMYAPVGWSQAQAEEAAEITPINSIDEITVYGERSIIVLQKQLDLAQVKMFDVFNTLNSTDEFDIECDYVQKLGSRRWHHVCEPKFATRQINQYGAAVLVRDHDDFSNRWVSPTVRRMDQELWQEMAVLVRESPELQKAYEKLANAKKDIDAERERRRND